MLQCVSNGVVSREIVIFDTNKKHTWNLGHSVIG